MKAEVNIPFLHLDTNALLGAYDIQEIQQAVSALPPPLAGRTFALTEGFWQEVGTLIEYIKWMPPLSPPATVGAGRVQFIIIIVGKCGSGGMGGKEGKWLKGKCFPLFGCLIKK